MRGWTGRPEHAARRDAGREKRVRGKAGRRKRDRGKDHRAKRRPAGKTGSEGEKQAGQPGAKAERRGAGKTGHRARHKVEVRTRGDAEKRLGPESCGGAAAQRILRGDSERFGGFPERPARRKRRAFLCFPSSFTFPHTAPRPLPLPPSPVRLPAGSSPRLPTKKRAEFPPRVCSCGPDAAAVH